MSTIHFTDEGEGTPLLFIHGYCESISLWSDFVEPFTKKFRVICIDLPGFGKSPLLEGEFTIGDIAKSVWRLLDSLNVKTCFVIGHSLGGYVTLGMADQQPHKILGLCLFHSTAFPDDTNKKANRTKVMEFVEKNGTPAFVRTLIPSLFADPEHERIRSLLNEARGINPKAVSSYARAMRDREDMTRVYVTLSKPILFFVGMKDNVFSPASILEQARDLPFKTIHQLDEVAHMGMIEAPLLTQTMLLNFVTSAE